MRSPIPDRYGWTALRRAVRDPRLVVEGANNLRRSAARLVQNARFRLTHGEPFDVMAEEWDVLVLLDACRADFYRERTCFDTPVSTRLSRGSGTPEFLAKNFDGASHHDTVYVSSNPYVPDIAEGTFHAVVPLLDEWDEEHGTVMPDDVTAAARDAAAEYPDKRLVVHYMQPHTPHIGPTAERIAANHSLRGWDRYHAVEGKSEQATGASIWSLVRQGELSIETLRQSYRESLDIVLEHVVDLVGDVQGRTVVSADHGEMLGERLVPFGPREFAHTTGLLTEPLRIVPWQVVAEGPRREVTADPPRALRQLSGEETRRRLRDLGYVE